MERYGLPKPDHRPLEAHPTISDDILSRMAHGEITPKPNIARLTERTVVFADGSEVEADIVIYCTGYKVTFPFFDEALISAPDNDLPLFRRVFHPDIAERLLHRAAAAARGDHAARRRAVGVGVRLPRRALRAARRRPRCGPTSSAERARMFKRYVASKRHTMQVDYDDYLADLGEGAQARRRAGARARLRAAGAAAGAAEAAPA